MAKLCPKGKAAAKRKFDVYPSAYANMYASKVCKGKVKAKDGGKISEPRLQRPKFGEPTPTQKPKPKKFQKPKKQGPSQIPKRLMREFKPRPKLARPNMMGGGMMKMPRAMYKKGGIAKGCGAVMSDRRKVTKVF